MRLRQGDSRREIARSGLQKTIDNRLKESSLLWDGRMEGRPGGVEVIVGDMNVELSAAADPGQVGDIGPEFGGYWPEGRHWL